MFFIPGILISIVTFPGVIVHEAAHQLFCRLTNTAIFKVCYFQFENPCGYVIHEQAKGFNKQWLISMGPFILNSVLCVIFCTAAFLPVWELKIDDPLAYFFAWLGLSIGMQAFPSTQDLRQIFDDAPDEIKRWNILAILSYPLIAVLFVLNFLRVVWADLWYGIAIGFLGPLFILKALS